jgi:hypothetical protein
MPEDGKQQRPDEPQTGAGEMSEAEIDKSLIESFPASDPPPWTLGTEHTAASDAQAEPHEDDE